jgi:hypothetical protein
MEHDEATDRYTCGQGHISENQPEVEYRINFLMKSVDENDSAEYKVLLILFKHVYCYTIVHKNNHYYTILNTIEHINSSHQKQAVMYNEQATEMMGMTANTFNKLSVAKRTKAASEVLDKHVFVTMYIPNKPTTQYSQFTIKTSSFCDSNS